MVKKLPLIKITKDKSLDTEASFGHPFTPSVQHSVLWICPAVDSQEISNPQEIWSIRKIFKLLRVIKTNMQRLQFYWNITQIQIFNI